MVMEAIWLSMQETEMQRDSCSLEVTPFRQYVSEDMFLPHHGWLRLQNKQRRLLIWWTDRSHQSNCNPGSIKEESQSSAV
ncbi:hypothetical protein F2Q69_00001692 [Brassica cretica]|uniref:Uncharacterized protein n=1 Tax=Brassica cretica TaxID=69181 RepID=A0A8S9NY81_BRACR|nr:hypothetical protein F2Q69_00001692 [Brassica cretica]